MGCYRYTWNINFCAIRSVWTSKDEMFGGFLGYLERKEKKMSFFFSPLVRFLIWHKCLQFTGMPKIWTTTQFVCMLLQIPFAGRIRSILASILRLFSLVNLWPLSVPACSSIFLLCKLQSESGVLNLFPSAGLILASWFLSLG